MDPLFDFVIYVTQVHASISPTMSSTKAIFRSRMNRGLGEDIYIHMSDMRDPLEK